MMTTAAQLGPLSLRLVPSPGKSPANSRDNWKAYMGQRPVPARLSVLADAQPRWRTFGMSLMMECIALILLISLPMLFPERLVPYMRYEVIPLAMPRTEVPLPPEPPKIRPRPKVEPAPEVPVEPPKLAKLIAPPKPIVPKVKPKEVPAEAPKLNPAFDVAKLEVRRNEPARPRAPVETGVLSTGSAAAPTLPKKVRPDQVQTGGFGDPNGIPGPGDPNKRANVAQKGQFELPGGPGYGNGTGGANGQRGTVASAGFGNSVAIQPASGGGRHGAVQSTSFSDATKVVEAPKRAAAPSASPVQAIEILAKPRPTYTEEARNLKLEGEVLLDVVFGASGQVQVNRVIRGLGHGLDEAAIRAAQQIKYKPALRNGQPVDFPATVHIVFQLAY